MTGNPRPDVSEARRVALITGASAGIGAAFARVFASEGFDLVLVARRKDRLIELARELGGEFGVKTLVFPADLSHPGTVKRITDELAGRSVTVDALVNNAGFADPPLSSGQRWETHRVFLEVMAVSVAEMCHALVPGMIRRGYGRIINVSSVSGYIKTPAATLYGPVKAFITLFSESLDQELKDQGVRVSALCPGYTRTEFQTVAGKAGARKSIPGFMWLSADRVAREGFNAVMNGRPVCIPGIQYKILVFLLKYLPFLRDIAVERK